ncbi:MAG: FAD-dependent oxidoreductase [Akkermansia sp.]|nr:FAD-dependent oxidoreductase [Akkermansia sp.]
MRQKKHFAIIGAGISGLSIARMLSAKDANVTIFEKHSSPGGLVRCKREAGVLYHCVGGHVFNSRNKKVLDWFWQQLNKTDFNLATRHAVVSLADGTLVDYPIENHLYQMKQEMREAILEDLLQIVQSGYPTDDNFNDFLLHRFGDTLYHEYFAPYNRKIWRQPLTNVPLKWLEGKLPMPTVKEILSANIGQVKEMDMVHSTFHYPRSGGSQFVADSLASGLDIRYNSAITTITRQADKWSIKGEEFDTIIFCGNVKDLPTMLDGTDIDLTGLEQLHYHGTTSVLCEVEANPYSWIYMPSEAHESHRIICTGNFAASNSPEGMSTATVEFSEEIGKKEILEQLRRIPFSPRYITHCYTPCTYPVQDGETRSIIDKAKGSLAPHSIYLLGRFAEWEYYNMDAAMEAAMKLCSQLET